jgi:uncharacterized protein GlcG (DUF336 family)
MTDPDLETVDPSRGPTAAQAAGLTLAAARRIIGAVEAAGRAMQVAVSVAVVDNGDQLIAFARMDGSDLVSIDLARNKAYSALMNRMPTGDLASVVQPGTEFYGYDSLAGGRMVVFAGGMPIERGGVLIGAIGVSGGSSEEDQRAADAGVAAFEDGSPVRGTSGKS